MTPEERKAARERAVVAVDPRRERPAPNALRIAGDLLLALDALDGAEADNARLVVDLARVRALVPQIAETVGAMDIRTSRVNYERLAALLADAARDGRLDVAPTVSAMGDGSPRDHAMGSHRDGRQT